MKLIIEIDKELVKKEHWFTNEELWTVVDAARNGTPIPDNATNKDIVKAVFGEESYNHCLRNVSDWWNAPYRKEDKNE